MTGFAIARGFVEDERDRVARIYWQGFAEKLGRVLGPQDRALAFLADVLDPDFAFVARCDGAVMGVAGFKTADGAFVGGDLADLARIYGRLGGLWRGLALDLLDRPVEVGRLLMDGIAVAPEARGGGAGRALLAALAAEAADRGMTCVRLDVIDKNPRARALYEREGFVAVSETHLGLLAPLFGFRSALRMERAVPSSDAAGSPA